jgi:hypothetical protein
MNTAHCTNALNDTKVMQWKGYKGDKTGADDLERQ